MSATASDNDGVIVIYQWEQLSGPSIALFNSNTLLASFTAPIVESSTEIVLRLTAIDDEGASTSDSVTLTIIPADIAVENNTETTVDNTAPSVSAGPDFSVNSEASVMLPGSASDSEGEIVSYSWTQVSGTPVDLINADTATASFTPPKINQSEFIFSAPDVYAAGNRPISVETADLNGDNNIDIAISNFRGDSVSVLLGNGDGTYQDAVEYPVGDAPYSVLSGDINHDDHPDLVTANASSDDVSILINKGNGAYEDAVNYAVGGGPWFADIGDLNSDGHPDLVTGNEWDDNASVLIGRGDGTFDSAVHYLAGDRSLVSIISDYNNDGYMDLAVTNQEGPDVSILLGYGDGTFSNPIAYYTVGVAPRSLEKGDFNGDGEDDLVVANEDSDNISILLGNGDATFQDPVHYAVGVGPRWAAVGDLNGDSIPDLAVANKSSDNITILAGHGDGTFSRVVDLSLDDPNDPDVPVWPFSVSIDDLNGDGRNDIVTADYRTFTTNVILNQTSSPNEESLVFRLTVMDDEGVSISDTVTVHVNPVP